MDTLVATTPELKTRPLEFLVAPDPIADLQPLLQRMQVYLPDVDLEPVKRAFTVARDAHGTQTRKSGELYIYHPLAVAHILVDMHLDRATIMAGLLHDVAEDTTVSVEEIARQFGDDVARIVDGLTKISVMEGRTKEQAQLGTYRKMFVAMADDPRVVLIKLADRLHNIRTLDGLSDEKQRRIAQETLDIYAPLAHRLGIWHIKWQLEDGAFRVLHPEKYQEISRQLNMRREARERVVERMKQRLSIELDKEGIKAELMGRPKHIYSIFRKMDRKNVSLDQIFDQLAVRVMVETVDQCYRVLGIVHMLWRPLLNQFDDYIAVPKESLYQSLHTTVMVPGEHPCEVQIRTQQMHEVAEHGIAAHWKYKEGKARADEAVDAKMQWLRSLLAWKQEMHDERELVNTVKDEGLHEQVYVFSPKGRIVELVQGATPVDFAYRIHSEVGNRCVSAKVNERQVSLDYQLRNGDIVDITTTRADRGPRRDWLNFVQTSNARNHIKRWFRRQDRQSNITAGHDLLDKEIKKLGLNLGFEAVAEATGFKTIEDMFYAVGTGENHYRELVRKTIQKRKEQPTSEDLLGGLPLYAKRDADMRQSGMEIHGANDIYKRIARCCNPVEGEQVVGYVTRGNGLTVHRIDCHNVINERQPERLMPVSWGGTKNTQIYSVPLRIEAWDRVGLWHDVTEVFKNNNINIKTVNMSQHRHPDKASLQATVMVDSFSELTTLMDKLGRVKDVIEVRRERNVGRGA